MKKTTLKTWLAEMRKMYNTFYVLPDSSFAARGARKTNREVLARLTSPTGGRYTAYGKTQKQRSK